MVVNPYRSESESSSLSTPCHQPHFNMRTLVLGCLILFSACSYIFHVNHDIKMHNTPKLRGEINRKPIVVINTETADKSSISAKLTQIPVSQTLERTIKPVQDVVVDTKPVDIAEHNNENVETTHELSSTIYKPAVKAEPEQEPESANKETKETEEHTEPLVEPIVEDPKPEFTPPVDEHTKSSRYVHPRPDDAITTPKPTESTESISSIDTSNKLVLEAGVLRNNHTLEVDHNQVPQSALIDNTDNVSRLPPTTGFVINMEDKRSDAIVSSIVDKALQAEAAAAELELAHVEKKGEEAAPITALSLPDNRPPAVVLSPPDHSAVDTSPAAPAAAVVVKDHVSHIPLAPKLPADIHVTTPTVAEEKKTDSSNGIPDSLKKLLDPIHSDDVKTADSKLPPPMAPPPPTPLYNAETVTSAAEHDAPVDHGGDAPLVKKGNEEQKIPHTADALTAVVDNDIPDTPSLAEVKGERAAAKLEKEMTPFEIIGQEAPPVESNTKIVHTIQKHVETPPAPPAPVVVEEVPFDINNAVPVSTTANNRPSSFDLKDNFVKHVTPKVVKVEEHPVDAVIDYCIGNIDPFESQPVESFVPPKTAPFEKAIEWKEAVKTMIKGIEKQKVGGDTLREEIKKEIVRLQIMRFNMFCMYANK